MRKIIRVDELPKGFYYFTDSYIVEGTGKNLVEVMKREGLRSEKRD